MIEIPHPLEGGDLFEKDERVRDDQSGFTGHGFGLRQTSSVRKALNHIYLTIFYFFSFHRWEKSRDPDELPLFNT